MEAEIGTSKARVVAYIDEDKINMTKAELLAMVNELHDKLAEKAKTRKVIGRIIGFDNER